VWAAVESSIWFNQYWSLHLCRWMLSPAGRLVSSCNLHAECCRDVSVSCVTGSGASLSVQSVARNENYEIPVTFQGSVPVYDEGLIIMCRLNDFVSYVAVRLRRNDVINRDACEATKQQCMYLDRSCTAYSVMFWFAARGQATLYRLCLELRHCTGCMDCF